MSRDFEDLLRARLAESVPVAPASPGRSSAARRYATRRRRTRIAGATAAVATVLAAPFTVAALLDGSSETSDLGVATAPPPSVERPFRCAADRERAPDPTHDLEEVPAGALLARVCPTGIGGSAVWSPPLDALTTNVDSLVATVNALPPQTEEFCQGSGGIGYALTLQYDDGGLVTIRGDTSGCSEVVLGDTVRAGATNLLETYFDLLRAQRRQESPPAQVAPASCPEVSDEPFVSPMAMTKMPEFSVAMVCAETIAGRRLAAELTSRQVAVVKADLAERSLPQGATQPRRDCTFPARQVFILGSNVWGDRRALFGTCSDGAGLEFAYDVADQPMIWRPSARVERLLVSLR